MLTREENELLCRVEGDAPMGRLMRRHWIPACMAEEVAERDGAPVRIQLLGEELVAFRDTLGRLAVMDEHCPHRRASLALGRNEECGLRCLYHGWKIDVDGNVVDMPSQPAGSEFAHKVKHRTYPCREAGGFVWVWMGEPDAPARFDPPAWAPTPQTNVSIVKMHVACNWAQVLEGAIDSAHSSSLHSTDMVPAQVAGAGATDSEWLRPSTDKAPRLKLERTSFGFRYVAIRKPIHDEATHDYLRITLFVAPFTVLIPPNDRYDLAILNIPQDDVNTMFYFIAWGEGDRGYAQEDWRRFCGAQVGVDLDRNYRRIRTRENNYLQDREAMKRGSFTGITGIPNQDIAMWETMGRIADRTRERPGASDLAIARFRAIMLDAMRTMQKGGEAIGAEPDRIAQVTLRSFEGVVPKSTDWTTLNVGEDELARRARIAQPAPVAGD